MSSTCRATCRAARKNSQWRNTRRWSSCWAPRSANRTHGPDFRKVLDVLRRRGWRPIFRCYELDGICEANSIPLRTLMFQNRSWTAVPKDSHPSRGKKIRGMRAEWGAGSRPPASLIGEFAGFQDLLINVGLSLRTPPIGLSLAKKDGASHTSIKRTTFCLSHPQAGPGSPAASSEPGRVILDFLLISLPFFCSVLLNLGRC